MDSPALTKEEKQAAKKKRLAAARKAGKKKEWARWVVQQGANWMQPQSIPFSFLLYAPLQAAFSWRCKPLFKILQAAFDAAGVTQQTGAEQKLATMTTAAADNNNKQPILAEAHSAILGQKPKKFPICLCPNPDCAYNVVVRMLGGSTTTS